MTLFTAPLVTLKQDLSAPQRCKTFLQRIPFTFVKVCGGLANGEWLLVARPVAGEIRLPSGMQTLKLQVHRRLANFASGKHENPPKPSPIRFRREVERHVPFRKLFHPL